VRDHLVRVHVAARAGARLEHIDRKLIVVLAFHDFERGLLDRRRTFGIERIELDVRRRRRPLDETERADEVARHAQTAQREIVDRALRLRAPQRVRGDLQLPQTIVLDAEVFRAHEGRPFTRSSKIRRFDSTMCIRAERVADYRLSAFRDH